MTDKDYLLLVKLLVRYSLKDILVELSRAVRGRPRDHQVMRRVVSFYLMLTSKPLIVAARRQRQPKLFEGV